MGTGNIRQGLLLTGSLAAILVIAVFVTHDEGASEKEGDATKVEFATPAAKSVQSTTKPRTRSMLLKLIQQRKAKVRKKLEEIKKKQSKLHQSTILTTKSTQNPSAKQVVEAKKKPTPAAIRALSEAERRLTNLRRDEVKEFVNNYVGQYQNSKEKVTMSVKIPGLKQEDGSAAKWKEKVKTAEFAHIPKPKTKPKPKKKKKVPAAKGSKKSIRRAKTTIHTPLRQPPVEAIVKNPFTGQKIAVPPVPSGLHPTPPVPSGTTKAQTKGSTDEGSDGSAVKVGTSSTASKSKDDLTSDQKSLVRAAKGKVPVALLAPEKSVTKKGTEVKQKAEALPSKAKQKAKALPTMPPFDVAELPAESSVQLADATPKKISKDGHEALLDLPSIGSLKAEAQREVAVPQLEEVATSNDVNAELKHEPSKVVAEAQPLFASDPLASEMKHT